ncbi:MAG TPA: AAA family ATPase [Gaiellaceae bacterium]
MAKAPPLSIALLGPPVIEVDGRPLEVDTRKATALLAYLAIEGHPVRRDTIAALLWPETDPERARSALRRTLSTLRSALGGRFVDADRELVSFGGPGIRLDVAELRRLLAECETHGHGPGETCPRCVEPLRAAVALDRGPFLSGFGLRDSVEFDDWLGVTTDALRREVAGALDRLAEALAAAGDSAGAIAAARRRLALDPLHEPAHRQLIRVYAESGDRSAALEQYRECVRVLDRELGVRPLDETTALYHAVLEGTHAPAPAAAPQLPVEPVAEAPLVGRRRELAALVEAYRSVGPDGRLAVVTGEVGIGKSRLGEELLAAVAAAGGRTIAVRCFQGETELAFGAVAELLRAALEVGGPAPEGDPWLAEAARLLPELGPAPARAVDSAAAQVRLYEAVCGLVLRALGDGPPGAVLVDDAHWADEASLGLLLFLANRLRTRPLLLVIAWQPEDVTAEHPLQRLLTRARRDRAARVLSLGRLTATDVEELLAAGGHDRELGARLHRESGGLPFFVVEYLDALAREDAAAAEWPVPGSVRELLAARLAALGELAGQVVAAASVLGRSFDPDTVRDASGRGDDEVVAALEELLARGVLVETDEGGALDFRHEQERSLVYQGMTLARRRLLHRRVAAALGARGQRELHAAVIAHHLALAGDEVGAAEAYRVAGDRARALYANAEALGHYRAALALGFPDPAALHEVVGDLETLAGDYAAALSSYQTAAALASPELAPEVDHRIGALHLRRGEWELAEASLAAALEGLEGAPAARATADRSLAAHRRGLPDEAARLAAEALGLAERAGDPRARAQAHNILGILAASGGDTAAAIDHLEESLALARATHDEEAEAAALNNLALAVGAGGDTERAIELTRRGIEHTVALGDRHREAALRNRHADLLHAAGRDDDAMAELKAAVAIFAEVGEEGKLEPEIWKLSEW